LTLEEIYQIIDKPRFVLTENHRNNADPLFKKFGDEKKIEGRLDLVKIAQTEIDAQNFVINNNKLTPKFSGTNDKGESFGYPSLNLWTDEDYTYLIKRQKQTKNPYLKAKYSHILWLAPKTKHLQLAKDALKEYVKIIRKLNLSVWANDNKVGVHILSHNIYNAFYLALSTNDSSEILRIKKIVLSIALKFRYDSDRSWLNISLVQLMLSLPKIFKKEDFVSLEKSCLKYADIQTSLDNKINILKIAEKIPNKLGNGNTIFLERIAICYEELSHQRESRNNLSAIKFCQDAIKYYKKLKNSSKVKDLENYYKHLKQTSNLESIKYEFDVTDIVKHTKETIEKVSKMSTKDIFSFLMFSPSIFPSYKDLYDEALKGKKENVLQFLMGTTLLDDYGHTSAHYTDDDEKIHFSIMHSFDIMVRISSLQIIHGIIFEGIKMNKLSSNEYINFIRNSFWLGQDVIVTYKQNEQKRFNWLHTLAPAINDFFSQIYFFNENPVNLPNFVLAIDSLSVKIEGILRDICELRGVTTFFQATDSKGRNIITEKDINALLREDTIKNTLSEDDLLLLQFVLVDKAGWNLRNRIAHTLIREVSDYGLHYILLLLVIILKLAKNDYAPLSTMSKSNG